MNYELRTRQSEIKNISDTAKWVAVFRADETKRADAVFKDPFAEKLAGESGRQMLESIQFSKQNSWSFVARTYLFDELIKAHIREGYEMVLNLAAGLDTRPYRMDLPGSLYWVEIDLPEIIDYKKQILSNETPKCKLETISMNLSGREERMKLFNHLARDNKKTLIISEGLIIYLTNEEVQSFAKDLSVPFNFHRWVVDLASPSLLSLLQKEMGSPLNKADAPLKFAPEEGEEFFVKCGWKPVESFTLIKTAAKLNRLPDELLAFASIPETKGTKRDMPWSGVCLLERSA
ncbi:MAG TPA: SAM-dependent methyltransferase [Chitinophagaceae bacterium]|nr:SAM-dependent methyltransferase [Chitinophagaceae bacterium]